MRSRFHAWALLSLCLAGCGSDDTVAVKGSVQLDGKPLEGAAVEFQPTADTKGAGGTGATDASGNFFVVSPQGVKGLTPGTYKVTVSKSHLKKAVGENQQFAATKSDFIETLPPIYSDSERTVLTATVGRDGKPVELRLESKATGKK